VTPTGKKDERADVSPWRFIRVEFYSYGAKVFLILSIQVFLSLLKLFPEKTPRGNVL